MIFMEIIRSSSECGDIFSGKDNNNNNNNNNSTDGNDDDTDNDSDNFIDMGVSLRELRSTRDALLRIADSVRSGGLSADVFVVLLTLLLIVLVSVATYICASQGVCALPQ